MDKYIPEDWEELDSHPTDKQPVLYHAEKYNGEYFTFIKYKGEYYAYTKGGRFISYTKIVDFWLKFRDIKKITYFRAKTEVAKQHLQECKRQNSVWNKDLKPFVYLFGSFAVMFAVMWLLIITGVLL